MERVRCRRRRLPRLGFAMGAALFCISKASLEGHGAVSESPRHWGEPEPELVSAISSARPTDARWGEPQLEPLTSAVPTKLTRDILDNIDVEKVGKRSDKRKGKRKRPFLRLPAVPKVRLQDARKLLSISSGELVLDTSFRETFERINTPVHLIVLFGKMKTGKSTLATLLSCALSPNTPSNFRASAFSGRFGEMEHTDGLWVTKPFTVDGKVYILADMQGLDDGLTNIGSHSGEEHSAKQLFHALVKVLAMLSEVSAVFVQVAGAEWGQSQAADLGHILKTTRENMITTISEEQRLALVETGGDAVLMKSTNHPALVIVRQNQIAAEAEEDDETVQENGRRFFEGLRSVDANLPRLLSENFEGVGRNVTVGDRSLKCPWQFHRLPVMREVGSLEGRDTTYDWMSHKPFEHGEGCETLSNMTQDKWEGTMVPLYYHQLQELSQKVTRFAVSRQLAYGEAIAQPLTGPSLWNFLEFGVEQMNLIGPLPESELWKHIMSGGCKSKGEQMVEEGLVQGALNKIAKMVTFRSVDLSKIEETWWQAMEQTKFGIKNFLAKGDFKAVRESCEAEIEKHIATLEETYAKLKAEGEAKVQKTLREQAENDRDLAQEQQRIAESARKKAEARVRNQAKQLKQMQDEEFERNKILYTIWGGGALVAVLVVMKIVKSVFSKLRVCKEACSCCAGLCTCSCLFRSKRRQTQQEREVHMLRVQGGGESPKQMELMSITDKMKAGNTMSTERLD